MRRSLIAVLIVVLLLAACAPAATPTTAPAQPAAPIQPQATSAAKPTQPIQPTLPAAPAAAPIGTQAPTSAPAEVRPPASGGVLNPPTLSPTAIGSRANVNNTSWITYRDKAYNFAFQYPPDWTFATKTAPPAGVVQRLSVARLNQSAGNNAEILIDVRKSSGDLFKWVKAELSKGTLLLDAKFIEGGLSALTAYNAKLGNASAVWVFAPTHSTVASVAALHASDTAYFYQITYLGDIPDNKDTRAVYLQLLSTLALSGTTTANLALPQTAFTTTK